MKTGRLRKIEADKKAKRLKRKRKKKK